MPTWGWVEKEKDYVVGSLEELVQAINSDLLVSGTNVFLDPERYDYTYRFAPEQILQFVSQRIIFEPSIDDFLSLRLAKTNTILSGNNNSGKSIILKHLFYELGSDSYLIGTNRIYHVSSLGFSRRTDHQFYSSFVQQFYTQSKNSDDNLYQLNKIITTLNDEQRSILFKLCGELIGVTFEIKTEESDNEFSPKYIDVDGHKLDYVSTGTRLLLTILGICLDTQFKYLLIDEPEIGLSPKIQRFLANQLLNPESRREYFPHLDHVFIATHSHLFLANNLSNNFVVNKKNDKIQLHAVQNIDEYHHLQINMLGNNLETLFLPSIIVMVEGKSDEIFLATLFKKYFPDRIISVVYGEPSGDGGILTKLNLLKQSFGDIQKSPYNNRIFIVLDSKTSVKIKRIRNFVSEENIIQWEQNGIEYQYPISVLTKIFACDEAVFRKNWIDINTDTKGDITINGITHKKTELAKLVSAQLSLESELSKELETFINKLRKNIY